MGNAVIRIHALEWVVMLHKCAGTHIDIYYRKYRIVSKSTASVEIRFHRFHLSPFCDSCVSPSVAPAIACSVAVQVYKIYHLHVIWGLAMCVQCFLTIRLTAQPSTCPLIVKCHVVISSILPTTGEPEQGQEEEGTEYKASKVERL